jgi:hypothetical protein
MSTLAPAVKKKPPQPVPPEKRKAPIESPPEERPLPDQPPEGDPAPEAPTRLVAR